MATNWEEHFEGKEHELLEEICQLTPSCDNCSLAVYCDENDVPWHEWLQEECDAPVH